MAKELYVGSLSYDVTEYDIEKLFSVSGRVTSIHLITDPKTGEFKGCGYVRMSTEAEAKDAIQSLDGALLIDRKITVSMANPQKQQTGGYKGKSFAPKKGGAASKGPAGGKAFSKGPSSPKPAAKAGFKPASKQAPKKGGGR
jgi:RNA recognition motif-containing protein